MIPTEKFKDLIIPFSQGGLNRFPDICGGFHDVDASLFHCGNLLLCATLTAGDNGLGTTQKSDISGSI